MNDVRRSIKTDLYCRMCGTQGLLVLEGDDYYHGSESKCLSCGDTHCCFDFYILHKIGGYPEGEDVG